MVSARPAATPFSQFATSYTGISLLITTTRDRPKPRWAYERKGVCRDFAHLGVTLCRAMNIPARYCTGYISDVGLPPVAAPMDFARWFQAYVGDSWQTFDPRNNAPRTSRVLMAYGRDAADVAISNAFGPAVLTHFKVHCDQE